MGRTIMELKNEREALLQESKALLERSRSYKTGLVPSDAMERYVGDKKLQKQAPQDYLTKKTKAVTYESYYLHSDHEGIIDRELWEKAQSIIEGRNSDAKQGIHRQRSGHHPLYGHLFCAECGAPFKRRTLTNSCGHYKAWNCAERQKGRNGNGCRNMVWKEEVLTDAVCGLLGWDAFDEKRFEEAGLNLKVDGRELAMA